jgi:dipeptidase E
MGGGGFTMPERNPGLDRLVLSLTGKPVPKICFLPTASGDHGELAMRFRARFDPWPCEPSVLSLFRLGRDRIDPVEHLLAQDAIYVGGGSMRNMLAIWREHSIDRAMRTAWETGIVLAGVSAGAMCWFQGGISKSGGVSETVDGLGLLSGSLSVHMDSEPERLTAYRAAVASGRLPPGYAADDSAGLLFAGGELSDCVASREGARVISVHPDRSGEVVEAAVTVRQLQGATRARAQLDDVDAIAELRALRAGRRRWR